MLRVGLTGGLGSGKSTVAGYLRELGAEVIEADALGRALMEPGQRVYAEIVRAFGPAVVQSDGHLNRARLAELAFQGGRLNELNAIVHPAVIEAQRFWMDAVFARDPAAVAVVESALIFEVERDARARGERETVLAGVPGDRSSSLGLLADWRRRIDRVIVVTAPDEVKIARYAARICPEGAGRAAGVPSDRGPLDAIFASRGGSDRSSSLGWEAVEADARLRLAYQIPDAEKAARADYVLANTGDIASLHAQVVALWRQLKAESNNSPRNLSLE
jgi:dephospho-CoA kinase